MLGKIRLTKVFLAMVVLTLLIMPAVTGFAATQLIQDPLDTANKLTLEPAISDKLGNSVREYIIKDTEARNWKLLDSKITLTSNEQSGSHVSAIFDVDRKHLLNYAKAEDAPAVKGRLEFMNKNGKGLSKKQLDKVQKEIAIWKHDITEYITVPQNSFDRIKIEAQLDSNESIIPGSVKILGEGPIGGEYIPINIADIPTPDKVKEDAYRTIKKSVNSPSPDVTAAALYQRLTARDYVKKWSSNTTKVCSTTSTTKQDPTYYNTAQYTKWYECNDCANFVSQGLNAGGIPTDTTWKPYTSAWIGVTALKDYMLNNNRMVAATDNNVNECVAGYPFRLSSGSHFMMMTYNDGTTRKYSAHTSDRNDVTWYTSTGAYYYRVVY